MGGGRSGSAAAREAARRQEERGLAAGRGGLAGAVRFAMPPDVQGHVLVAVEAERLGRHLGRLPPAVAEPRPGQLVHAPRITVGAGDRLRLAAGGGMWAALVASGARRVPVAVARGQVTRLRAILGV